MTDPPPGFPRGVGVPVSAAAWLLLVLLTTLNVLNFVHRQLIPSLAPLLIADLHLTRADIGLLIGFAFIIFYTVVGMVLGVAADRWSRRGLIAAGLALWSAMTALSGAATGFASLAVPRVLLGIGQATLTPAALSMLGDAFPRRRLGLATGVYYAGLPVGTGMSLAVAGWLAPLYGWRVCFYVLGLVGLAAVSLLFVTREPPQQKAALGAVPAGPSARSFWALAGDLRRALITRPALGLIMLGGAALAYGSAAATHGVTWLVQERGFDFANAAMTAGLMAVASGFFGNLAGGWIADWCARRWRGGRSWSLVMITWFFAPFNVAFFLLSPGSALFYICWFFSVASTVAYFGPALSAVQELSPSHIRASALAFALLVFNVAGVGPGAWLTGAIGDGASLTHGLMVSIGVGLAGTALFTWSARLTPAAEIAP